MRRYIGTKIVKTTPMTKGEYNKYRGWDHPEKEDASEAGFLVEDQDGGKPNDDRHEGYITWSPLDAFEKSCRPMVGMTFGLAIEFLKKGLKVARIGWNGKGMYLQYVVAKDFEFSEMLPFIAMKTVQNSFVPWLASQTDVLAEDWMMVE
jgi:hypothetical protein